MKSLFTSHERKEIISLEKKLEAAGKITDPVEKLLAHDALHREAARQVGQVFISRAKKILLGFTLCVTGALTAGLGGSMAVALPLIIGGGGIFALLAGRDSNMDLCMKIADTCSTVMNGIVQNVKTPDVSKSPQLAEALKTSPRLKDLFLKTAAKKTETAIPTTEQKNTPPDHFRP